MDNQPLLSDLRLFHAAARRSSFVATAAEFGASPAFVSKRIAILEKTLGVTLFDRTTRRVVISEDGEAVLQWARKILQAADGLSEALHGGHAELRGMLRISADSLFGRTHLAPVLAEFSSRYPELEISLRLVDRPVDLLGEAVDIDIRVGEVQEPQLSAQRILESNRILCAAPAYLERHGYPLSLADLAQHDCLVLREGEQSFGVWRLHGPGGIESVKVSAALSTNSADIARIWALAGQGIVLVADRDIAASLAAATMVHLLPAYRQPADVWAVCRNRPADSANVGRCLRFLKERLGEGSFAIAAAQSG